MNRFSFLLLIVVALVGCNGGQSSNPDAIELFNVSYDPTRELWKSLNTAFIDSYQKQTGKSLTIRMSNGASGSQARTIIDGLPADVATLSLFPDTDALRTNGLLKEGWVDSFPNKSLPYTSTLVFVVRTGNPKGIKDWADLAKPGVSVITPNPKTSGNGRISFLGAWASVILNGGNEESARDFVRKLYSNVPVLDTGARSATMTFAQKGLGDVHLTMENEAFLEIAEHPGKFEIVYPSISFLHEPHVAVIDKQVDQRKTREAAEAYLQFLYTPEGQEIIAKHYFRPTDPEVLKRHQQTFRELRLFRVTDIATGWEEVQRKFFGDGGLFESIYRPSTAG